MLFVLLVLDKIVSRKKWGLLKTKLYGWIHTLKDVHLYIQRFRNQLRPSEANFEAKATYARIFIARRGGLRLGRVFVT